MPAPLNYISLVRSRHSTRSYEQHVLTQEDRSDIGEAIASAVPLNSPHLLDWKLAEKAIMGSSAVLYAQCGSSVDELVEYGYQGEQIVLALHARQWGTCWYYQFRMPGSPCSITVGRPATPGLRSAFMKTLSHGDMRKPLERLVTNGIPQDSSPLVRTVLASARLAPSAMNRQPWSFEVVSDTEILIKGDANGFPDLGICLANAMVTARQLAGEATVSSVAQGMYHVAW